MQTIHLIDIGTHDGQEISLITGRHSLFGLSIHLLKLFKAKGIECIINLKKILNFSDKFSNNFKFRLICIEPIMSNILYSRIKIIKPDLIIKGIVSSNKSSFSNLYLSKNRLGNSIYKEKPNLSGKTIKVANISFSILFKELVLPYYKKEDILIVRINAEGIEKDLIDYLIQNKIEIDLLAGSIGDIKKCWGESVYKEYATKMIDNKISFVYFTSNPFSWLPAMQKINQILNKKTLNR